MNQELVLDEKAVRILDLLQQLKRVNDMIAMHQKLENGDFMVEQYERQKRQFVKGLQALLLEYELAVEPTSKAA
ncbi:MAG: hypothetical protein K9J37_02145 [Saprospiraceae bacterium]|nr:hypothetical protein [Saprospiraceae bacterium]MCF8248680.1 hypothetical protein [Saprospiraceae bacterium]MCF8278830.1 hypothetical protein [Bacteroidales bacterium]MCF8310630.1 hypothetical protein [Saprospiraceae bacterium]MCF8439189.1 hypothetical protein [Saprospiraceae bacterium]